MEGGGGGGVGVCWLVMLVVVLAMFEVDYSLDSSAHPFFAPCFSFAPKIPPLSTMPLPDFSNLALKRTWSGMKVGSSYTHARCIGCSTGRPTGRERTQNEAHGRVFFGGREGSGADDADVRSCSAVLQLNEMCTPRLRACLRYLPHIPSGDGSGRAEVRFCQRGGVGGVWTRG